MSRNNLVGVMVGRFQPITRAHLEIITNMSEKHNRSIVFLVDGNTASDHNPISLDCRIRMIAQILPGNVELKVIPTGFFVDTLNSVEATDFVVYAGSDRVTDYKRFTAYADPGKSIRVHEVKRTLTDVSASKVRKALRQHDKAKFKRLTPKRIHSFYKELLIFVNG